MITVTLEDVVNCGDTFRQIANYPIKVKTAYNIAKIIKSIEKETQLFEDTRQKLLDKYCEKDENGELKTNDEGRVNVIPEFIKDYNKDIRELFENKVDIAAEPIKLEDLEILELTPAQMYIISAFIEE